MISVFYEDEIGPIKYFVGKDLKGLFLKYMTEVISWIMNIYIYIWGL